MFDKLMNSYYYGKSGKGDFRKEDLPTTRWQLFWEMLRVRLSALVRLNLIYMIAWLPAMLVMLLSYMAMLTAAGSEAETGAVADIASMMTPMLLLLVPCIGITGPFTAGLSYVTRNWARDEHAFIWADFKDAMKDNWKQALPVSIVTGFMPLMVYIGWRFYGTLSASSPLMMVPQFMLLLVALIFALTISYVYPMMVTYKLTLRGVLRNSLLLGVGKLPISLAMRLLHCVPAALALVAALLWNPLWPMMILFAYYVLIGFALSRFITASFTNAVFDQVLNPQIPGAEVNRGLNPDPDACDDDEEDDEETDA